MTLKELPTWEEFLENVDQFGWLGTPTNSFSLQLVELRMDCMTDQDGSWIKMILKDKCVSRIVLIMKLFLWTFCE